MSGPTIEEMRQQLIGHCAGRDCNMCALGKDNLNCGTGVFPTALDSLIEAAYNKVFGNTEQVAMGHDPNEDKATADNAETEAHSCENCGNRYAGLYQSPCKKCEPNPAYPNWTPRTAEAQAKKTASENSKKCWNCAFVHKVETEEPCRSCDWTTKSCWKPKQTTETIGIDAKPTGIDKYAIFERICAELLDLYKRKNNDYGDSFAQGFAEYGLIMPVIRIEDKVRRFKQLALNPDSQMVNDEKLEDTARDAINYLLLTLIEMECSKAACGGEIARSNGHE